MTDKDNYSKEQRDEARARVTELKALIASGQTLEEAVPTEGEFSDTTTYADSEGNIYEELTVDELRAPDSTKEVFDKVGTFQGFKDMLSGNTTLGIELIYVPSFSDDVIQKYGLKIRSNPASVRGLHVRGVNGGKATVFINGSLSNSRQSMIDTLAHETIGHYGLRKIFEKHGGYDNFLKNLLQNNPAMTEDILSLSKRWNSYLESWKMDNIPGYTALVIKQRDTNISQRFEKLKLVNAFWANSKIESIEHNVYQGGIVTKDRIPMSIAIQLADEYMAEQARHFIANKEFIDREVGMGLSKSAIERRSTLSKQRERWFNIFITKVKHLLRSVFGNYFDHISHDSLAKLVAQSIDNTFGTINPDVLFGSEKPFTSPLVTHLDDSVTVGDGITNEMFVGQKATTANLGKLKDAKDLLKRGIGKGQVRRKTGWFQDFDRRWKFEITDHKSKLTFLWNKMPSESGRYLEGILDHPELFKAYPELRNIHVFKVGKDIMGGANGKISVPDGYIALDKDLPLDDVHSTLLHEIQHFIQDKENFAVGGSPQGVWYTLSSSEKEILISDIASYIDDLMSDPNMSSEERGSYVNDKADITSNNQERIDSFLERSGIGYDMYQALWGEVESRNTETRKDLTTAERKETSPAKTSGVESLIVAPKITFKHSQYYSVVQKLAQVHSMEEVGQLTEDETVNAYVPGRIEDVKVFHNGVMSGFGSHTETVRSRSWNKLNESINNNPILAAFKALGNLNSQQAYEAMGTLFKGQISQAEEYVKGFVSSIKNLNALQNQAVFEYMTTKDADPEALPVTPLQRKAIVKAKESIRTIGKSLNEMGLISDEAYEKNEDQYLHVMYMKYIDQYKGSNKKTSMMSWWKKRGNLSDRERLALGEIKDVRFLIPETLGTMARDHVLLQMFDTIGQMSRENNLYWVMSRDIKIKYPGRRTKLTLEQAYEQLEQNRFILDMHDKNNTQVFGTADKNVLIEELRKNTGILQANIVSLESAEAKMLNEAYEAAKERGETKAEDASKFLLEQYVRLPNKKQMGALANKWVRKEIANDLDAITSAYSLSDKNTIERFFAQGGTLERINQLWKMSMVALNPGSWVRNTLGNFSLLDLSTDRNKGQLISWLVQEVSGSLQGNQSEFWKLAIEGGLFGSTWSATELRDMQETYGSDLKDALKRHSARGDSLLDKQLHFLDERLWSVGKIAAHKVGAGTSKGYAFVEGAFKAVALRDYISTWEEQNKAEYPGGYKSLPEDKFQILLAKAATHANDAIFDYSQVNSMIKTLRRIPFGSPFITFTYKAGPASVRAMVNHPIKFAQYATLPALLTAIAVAYNDWDDDDMKKYNASLTDYQRLNPGIAFLPFKDKVGRPQVLPLDYMIPWSQYATASRKIYENFVEDGGESPVSTSVKSVGTALNEFGFLGGPTPTAIAAMLSGKDDFTGRSIVTPGASTSQQLGESMLFAYNMAAPAWLSSHGWFSKMYDAFKDKPKVDRFGNIKYTPLQAVSDITGFRATSVNVNAGLASRKLGYEAKLREIATLRSKTIKDRNETNKAGKLKEINAREKLVRSQMIHMIE